MSSKTRYANTYGTTTGSYHEQGSHQDAREAAVERRRRAWRACQVNDAINAVVISLCVLALAGTLGWAAVSIVMGYGQ